MILLNEHELVTDEQERLEPWTSYDDIVRLAMDFIKNCPVEPANGMPWYMQYSCFWTDPLRPTIWPDNPAGKFAWATTTLLKYYPYSGDTQYIEIVRTMLDHLWEYRTPDHYNWPGALYASANPGTGIYFGARADGYYVTEPDKIAQVGRAFVDFYEVTGEEHYLEIGKVCADLLLTKIRQGDETHSPWPFRVDVRDGTIVEEYTAHMIPAVRLFEELTRLGYRGYREIRDRIWNWIEAYPLKNNIWKGHFEDIRLDPGNENRDQLSPLETARYILQHQDIFSNWKEQVRDLIEWVRINLGAHPFFTAIPIHEQKFCWFPMGSHTARFASLCSLYAEETGDVTYREMGIRSFNWATYMATKEGFVHVGVDRPDYYNQCWFTDGYFDYVPHFIDGMVAIPETAPADTDHMLRSTSAVQDIRYAAYQIEYRTFEPGIQKLRLTFQPRQIFTGGRLLEQKIKLDSRPGWFFDGSSQVLVIQAEDVNVKIVGR